MEDTILNPSLEPQLFSTDPISLLLSRNSDKSLLNSLCGLERGPRYEEYARLRESKLRMKRDFEKILKEEEDRFFGKDQPRKKPARSGFIREEVITVSPEKIQKTRFGFNYKPAANLNQNSRKASSSVAQSVPDFSAMIRKENRRPVSSNLLPQRTDLTPSPTKSRNAAVFAGSASSARGTMSAGDKKSKAMGMSRKSYATVEDLKKISTAAAYAINGGGVGGRKLIGVERRKSINGGRTILGCRQMY